MGHNVIHQVEAIMQRRRRQAVWYTLIGTITTSAGASWLDVGILTEIIFAVGMVIIQSVSLLSTD